jgi:hypothetical protein
MSETNFRNDTTGTSDELRAGIDAWNARLAALGGYGIRVAATMPDGSVRTGVLREGAALQPWLEDETNGKRYVVSLDRLEVLPTKPSGLVILETMPEHLRASHRAAGNWGSYPHNGAERRTVSRDEAEQEIEADADGYARIVGDA